MNLLYVTCDRFDQPTGGSQVVTHELKQLRQLGEVDVINPDPSNDPFEADTKALEIYRQSGKRYQLACFYAGTFSQTVNALKADGCKVSYSCDPHDVGISRQEFEKWGIPFNFPHLVDPLLWQKYIAGYLTADIVTVPSRVGRKILRKQECKNVTIVPHGHYPPKEIRPLPKEYVVGYLGAMLAPDKGLIYLLEAWKELAYKDTTLLLGGRIDPNFLPYVRKYGGGNIRFTGWVEDTSDFYNQVSLYVQPSATEGFGIEVLEAMAHGRPVICSQGAGAHDCLECGTSDVGSVRACSLGDLIDAVKYYKDPHYRQRDGEILGRRSQRYTWEKIHPEYVWRKLL